MHALPEAAGFSAFVRRIVARARWRAALTGAAAGLGLAALVVATTGLSTSTWTAIAAVAAASVAIMVVAFVTLARITPTSVVDAVERQTPESRNLLRTALEISDARLTASPFVATRVMQQAEALASRTDIRRALPLGRAAGAAVVGAVVLASALALSARGGATPAAGPSSSAAASLGDIRIAVTSPSYAQRPPAELTNPQRVDALAGSRLNIRITADASAVGVATLAGEQDALRSPSGDFEIDVPADADGFLSIEARSSDGARSEKRLIGLYVQPDRAPAVTVTAPGKDMLVPDADRTLTVSLAAEDDLALASLTLAYTKISGSGENFEFVNGEVPVAVTRTSGQKWTATANWSLASLKLGPGDMVVYRGVARDHGPGAPAAESDAFFVEIAAPGSLPSEGFAVDDRFDRYAISQQMVIVKTERLLAERKAISSEQFTERALDIAAEQRQVRAEFVFMMGGSLEDHGHDADSLNEEAEAAGEDDLAAGRLVNRGRAEITRAIRAMARAAARLADSDATGALPVEKEALDYLQRAFSRNRIILRTLSERERLDVARRLTGVLADLARDARPRADVEPNPVVVEARRALADLAAIGGTASSNRTDVAERILGIRPTSIALRDAAGAVTSGDIPRAAELLAQVIRDASPSDPAAAPTEGLRELSGAITDALRRRGSK